MAMKTWPDFVQNDLRRLDANDPTLTAIQ